ncbi:MAG: hypothetical protein H8F28_20140 [Fibrella sp.]|nr:hypothetical protein [Armatimonadota bacterium]
MRRFVTLFFYLYFCGTLAFVIPLAGCKSKSDAPTPPAAPSQPGAKSNVTRTVPPEVQVGPPK